ncbi:adenosylmethionine decarboxylase [Shewanella algidipiscicola]|uniref:adenosylmethionine decarboxylase n=1 Tax=Shewanella algidipiscicola TaxID=614070 RepID=UPI000D7825BB|nr:adenosylmethionine decarboxylase [Shewanella algidipiscicola]
MLFEGAEKRLEMVIDDASASLRGFTGEFWSSALAKAGAEILSTQTNADCDAYVLSESSLFVWHNKLLLITCGNTSLVDTTLHIVKSIGIDHIVWFSYQRKSELFPHLQATRFEEDIARLKQSIAGQAYRIGDLDSHHHYLFCCAPSAHSQYSCALQLYHIKGDVADYLCGPQQSKDTILSLLQLGVIWPEFTFDDYLFDPMGYSVNGIHGREYITLHITPQQPSSYVSIETNMRAGHRLMDGLNSLITVFKPSSWDVVGINASLSHYEFMASQLLAQTHLVLNDTNTLYISHYKPRVSEPLTVVSL